jgi:predicted secreted acid phosphatase
MTWSRAIHRATACCALLAAIGCGAAPPPSLPAVKSALVEYGESGAWQADVAKVSARAERFLERRAGSVERPALVLDIDETSLSNWPQQVESDFCYVRSEFTAWVLRGEAEALPGVLELYRTAVRLGVAVFFITGRPEEEREATERNLKAVGYDSWAGLHLRSSGGDRRTFKISVRRQITEDGYTILANVGDQESDLVGGYAERTFKIPNPFYEVP